MAVRLAMVTQQVEIFIFRKYQYAFPINHFSYCNHTPSKKGKSITSCQSASFSIFMVSSLESVSSWRSFSMFTSDRTSVTCSTDSRTNEEQCNILMCTVCTWQQCCGSGSVGSICFWASPGSGSISQRYGSGSGSFYHQAKIVRNTLIPAVL
jgi:hypothetical protein